VASGAVVAAGLVPGVGAADWCLLVLAMVAVWTAEGLNTAFELLADAATPEHHPVVKRAKDVAAGAVLLAAIGAVAIGLLVLDPALLE